MNYLYLIGNGFDLAHGLPTSYNDFILNFFKKSISTLQRESIYDVGPMVIYKSSNGVNIPESSTLNELLDNCQLYNIKIDYKNTYFQEIVKINSKGRWVDIEYAYYQNIKDILINRHSTDYHTKFISKLNEELFEIKTMLIKYLRSLKLDNLETNKSINSHIIKDENDNDGQNLFLNFNYTNVIEKYIDKDRSDEIINIHGCLNDNIDDIIFGYGDEMDSMYPEIERLNINAYLNNFKSFGYLKKSHYQRVQSFLEADFEVIIMGHSCGISDRVLLNAIFTNKHCKKIHICYHQKNKTENDFFEKTQEISRHFGKSNKEEMRIKIVPFDQSKPLIPIC